MEGVSAIMSVDSVHETLNEANFIRTKVIKDLETGNEYPYSDVSSAVAILRRIARLDGCSMSLALETLWIQGCSPVELQAILLACRT